MAVVDTGNEIHFMKHMRTCTESWRRPSSSHVQIRLWTTLWGWWCGNNSSTCRLSKMVSVPQTKHKQKYAEFCTVMVSICITPSYWKTKSAVYDFVNGCIHGYAFCSQILLKLSNWNMFKFLSVPVLNGSRVWDYKNINPQTSTACQIPHYCNTWTPGQLARNLNKQFCSVRASHHCRLQQHIRSARRIVFSSLVERGC
jgi:hypothetical protein